MKKVAIIGTVGIPAKYGGFETLVHHLTKNLRSQFDFTVYCSSAAYSPKERETSCNGSKLVYIPLKANGFQSILYDMISIFHALFYSEVLLILGVSGAVCFPLIRWFTHKKIIVNIDGMEWRRSKWNPWVKKFLKFSEKMAVKYAHKTITDNSVIQEYAQSEYEITSELIEYGGDHVHKDFHYNYTLKKYQLNGDFYALKVARIEPENNIHVVLSAFSKTNTNLVIIGNWNNSEYGKKLKSTYSNFPQLHLFDPIYDQKELDALRQGAKLYIHGHSAGGTNPSLVEAMCLGLPIISYDVDFNRATTENQALFFANEKELLQKVSELQFYNLKELGGVMSEIAHRRYSWHVIAEKYHKLILSKEYQVQNSMRIVTRYNRSFMDYLRAIPVLLSKNRHLMDNEL